MNDNKMNGNKMNKFENPARLAELDPKGTLIKAGLKDNMTVCDIGAGTGIFSFPAAQISDDDIFALEISDGMIELLNSRINERKILNIKVKKVEPPAIPLDSNICDMALMVTVLHEIEDKTSMFNEIKRVLKKNGRLLIIEFHKRETPMGPPVEHRISEEFTQKLCKDHGFKTIDAFSLGANFYGIVFEKSAFI